MKLKGKWKRQPLCALANFLCGSTAYILTDGLGIRHGSALPKVLQRNVMRAENQAQASVRTTTFILAAAWRVLGLRGHGLRTAKKSYTKSDDADRKKEPATKREGSKPKASSKKKARKTQKRPETETEG